MMSSSSVSSEFMKISSCGTNVQCRRRQEWDVGDSFHMTRSGQSAKFFYVRFDIDHWADCAENCCKTGEMRYILYVGAYDTVPLSQQLEPGAPCMHHRSKFSHDFWKQLHSVRSPSSIILRFICCSTLLKGVVNSRAFLHEDTLQPSAARTFSKGQELPYHNSQREIMNTDTPWPQDH